MKEVEYFTWWMPPWNGKKPHRSRWKMTREEAAKYGATEPVDGSLEIRRVDLTPEEQAVNSTSAWQKNGGPESV